MSQPTVPPPTLPEQEAVYRHSRYQRRRYPISFWGLFIGLLIGLGVGAYYSYFVDPIQETSTRPDQLNNEATQNYVVAIMLAYSHDSDLLLTYDRLLTLNLGNDPVQAVADIACDLARTGYVDSNSGLRAVRAMRTFYQLQGRTGCADTIIPDSQTVQLEVTVEVPTPTATLPPPPTKTPSSVEVTVTPEGVVVVPTNAPRRTYEGNTTRTFCNEALPGMIEVRVLDGSRQEVGGETVRVQWEDGESVFVTGLKPERGVGYADFQMDAGINYIISMPGLSDPVSDVIEADSCTDPTTGNQTITSYEVVFIRTG